jgi:Antitoxin Phd_YefM, type II toxin-antitoxin system
MARSVRKTLKEVPLAEVKDDFSRYLKEAAAREIVITRHGKPAGVLIVCALGGRGPALLFRPSASPLGSVPRHARLEGRAYPACYR